MAVLPPYQLDTMDETEENIGIEIEAPTTFGGGALADEDTMQGYDEEENEQLPQDDESMNDESVNDATSYASAGYSYITSNIKWFVIAMASFAAFFGIGIGLGYGPIGNSIYGNDNESSVSSARAVDFTTSNNGAKSGKGEGGGGAKSGKSSGAKSGKSLKESEKCVSSSSKQRNAGCKLGSCDAFEDYVLGRTARGKISSYETDNCRISDGPPGRLLSSQARQLVIFDPACIDIDFWKVIVPTSGIHTVEWTAKSFMSDTIKPVLFPVMFNGVKCSDCTTLSQIYNGCPGEQPALISMGEDRFAYELDIPAGWHTMALFSNFNAPTPGQCGGDEENYTVKIRTGSAMGNLGIMETPTDFAEDVEATLSFFGIGQDTSNAQSNDRRLC